MLQSNFVYLRSGNLDGFDVDPWFKSFRQTQWIVVDIHSHWACWLAWKAHGWPCSPVFWKAYLFSAMKSSMKSTKSRGGLQFTALQWNWPQQLTCGITTLETIIIKALLRKWWLIFNASTIFNTCQFVLFKMAWRRHPASQLQSWNYFCHDFCRTKRLVFMSSSTSLHSCQAAASPTSRAGAYQQFPEERNQLSVTALALFMLCLDWLNDGIRRNSWIMGDNRWCI